MKLSIVSPWYKSKESVHPLYAQCLEAVHSMKEFDELEFVFVEDGSNDGTWEALAELAHADTRVKSIRLSRNFGQHHALTACLDLCQGDWVVVMDCDLQDRPEEIPRLWITAQEGYDMVCARRGNRRDTLWKRATSRIFMACFNWLSDMNLDPQVANFRIMNRKVIDAYRRMREGTRCLGSQVQWLGFRVGYVNVHHGARFSGKSSYTLRKLFALAQDLIVAYSNKPLRISIHIGIIMFIFSLLGVGGLILRKIIWGVPIIGWTSIIVSIWFIGGLVIGNLGIIGIYLGKIYTETKNRPIYVIDKMINIDKNLYNLPLLTKKY